jgi:hypothetical protein
VEALPDLEATVELFADFPIPEFVRETKYLSLGAEDGYPLLALIRKEIKA